MSEQILGDKFFNQKNLKNTGFYFLFFLFFDYNKVIENLKASKISICNSRLKNFPSRRSGKIVKSGLFLNS